MPSTCMVRFQHNMLCKLHVISLVSYPDFSVFNDGRRKTREPGQIYHVHDVECGKGLVQCEHTSLTLLGEA